MTDLTIGEHEFVLGRMPVFKQFHVARRLSPILATIVGAEGGVEALKGGLAGLRVQPIAEALAQMSDADADYILHACLGIVSLRQEGRLTPIFRAGNLMFDWITMPQMLQIAAEVIMQDLAGFMAAARSSSAAQPAA